MQDLLRRLAEVPAEERQKFIESLDTEELFELERLTERLIDFIPRVTPTLESPLHLQPLVDLLEAAAESPQKATVSTPPQHGKTQTCMHALIWLLRRDPTKRHAYATYAATKAERNNEELQQIADRAGLKWTGNRTAWKTQQRGGVIAAGIGGPLTGEPVDGVLLVDDPVKNFEDANSALIRDNTDEWFKTVARTRLHPSASIIVVQTRWHEDDLSGRLIKRPGWKPINLKAIDEQGRALWPTGRPLDFLNDMRGDLGEYNWSALFQGEPRPRGGAVFGDATYYKKVPEELLYRVGMGVDLAYTKTTVADWSVVVTMLRVKRPGLVKTPPLFYVLDVQRKQVPAPQFKAILRAAHDDHPAAPMRWYASGTEKGIRDFITEKEDEFPGIPLTAMTPRGDKFARAQPAAAAWNKGRILLPEGAPWVSAFVGEVCSFTGVNDAHDDQVDALAAAYDELAGGWAASEGDLDEYEGNKPRDQRPGAEPSPQEQWTKPASHATDTDKIKKSGRW